MKKKWRLLTVLLLVCSMLLNGCGAKEKTTSEDISGEGETALGNEVTVTLSPDITAVPEVTMPPETTGTADITKEPEITQEPDITSEPTVITEPDQPTAPIIAAEGTPYEIHGALSVDGTVLRDQNGNITVLQGVSTHGLSWFPEFANYDAFRTMRDEWGISVVRLAMYTAEYNGYCTGDESNRNVLKQKIYDCVDAATQLGLYVIVDWHVLQDQNPNTYKDQAISFFSEVTQHLKNQDNVIYEICNEPNGGVGWQDVKSYAEAVIPVIRQNAPNAIIIVGTPTWSQDVDQAAANPIKGYDNIMYALHFYADTHRDSLRNKMVSAIQSGLPIFVSEYGICDASGAGAINSEQANLWMDLMMQYNVSFCAWSLSNKNETSSMIRSDCSKTSDWTYEELSASGQWFVDWMRSHAGVEPAPLGQNSGTGSTGSANGNQGNGQSSANGSGTGQTAQNNNQSASALSATATDNNLTVSVNVSNHWETEGKYYYQCDVRFSNQGSGKINGWEFTLSADQSLALSQGWCGSFSVSGGAIKGTPESYNAVIDPGTERGDIGIILCSDRPVTSLQVSVTAK
ncbi:MAG: cellulase family glycosylhydrolase [Lachnospiraceae bacterium]